MITDFNLLKSNRNFSKHLIISIFLIPAFTVEAQLIPAPAHIEKRLKSFTWTKLLYR